MTNWATPICLAGLMLSLWLVLRQHRPWSTRCFSALIQLGVWLLVWALFFPPALLPGPTTLTLDTSTSELPAPGKVATLKVLELTSDGLTRDALSDLPPVRLQHSTQTEQPIWEVHWDREITLGEPLVLEIRLTSGNSLPLRLSLEDPFGGDADSAVLSVESPHIVLHTQPKLAGNWLYRVRVESTEIGEKNAGAPREEVLPVVVREAHSPHVLLWLSRPRFESAALGRWLRASGTPTQVVTQLAPKILRRETFNGKELRDGSLLAGDTPFDLLILDSGLWLELSPTERGQLANLPPDKSLLWLVDEASSPAFVEYAQSRGMPLQRAERAAASYSAGGIREELPTLRLTGYTPSSIQAGDAGIRLATGDGEREIYWARVNPQQSLGFVLFSNSYRWQTAGYTRQFAQLWKQILDHQLAQRGQRVPVVVDAQLPLAGRRLALCGSATDDSQSLLYSTENGHVSDGSVQPSVSIGGYAENNCHYFWPQQAGWHRFGDTDAAVYVFKPNAWLEWQAALANAGSAKMSRARLGPQLTTTNTDLPVPPPWLGVSLMALLALTWWRERHTLR